MTIAIFGNTNKRATMQQVDHILWFMQRHEVRVLLSRELRDEMNLREDYEPFDPESEELVDFALSIGGDGTFLTTASQVVERNIPILGINVGHLGFLAEVQTGEVDDILRQLISNQYTIEQRSMLHVTCSGNAHIIHPYALNEVALMKQELSSMITVHTSLNGDPLHAYRADGLVLSTPTGSTAYNLSTGGPISVPQAKVMIISPVASHSLTDRPLVIPDDWVLDLRVSSRSGSYLISVDGRAQRLSEEVTLHVEKAPYTIKLVRLEEHSFINSLKNKLNWGL